MSILHKSPSRKWLKSLWAVMIKIKHFTLGMSATFFDECDDFNCSQKSIFKVCIYETWMKRIWSRFNPRGCRGVLLFFAFALQQQFPTFLLLLQSLIHMFADSNEDFKSRVVRIKKNRFWIDWNRWAIAAKKDCNTRWVKWN